MMPLRNASPDEPRIAKLVMFEPKRLSRKTNVPSERLATKKSSALFALPAPEREDADVEHEREVGEDDGGGDHGVSSACV